MAEPMPVPFAAECHEEVNRRCHLQPCDRPAVALRLDPHELTPYPVCSQHRRAPMVALRDLIGLVATTAERLLLIP